MKNLINIPIYRAKKRNGEYIIGLITEMIKTPGNIIIWIGNQYEKCDVDPSTLAICFPDMLAEDSDRLLHNGEKDLRIFASLSKDGKGGDIAWIREPVKVEKFNITTIDFKYLADNLVVKDFQYPIKHCGKKWIENCKGIPNGCIKEMARTFLRVVEVRVERLQDIDLPDMFAEGCPFKELQFYNQDESELFRDNAEKKVENWFISLWNSTAPVGKKWEDNPLVEVYVTEEIEYRKIGE